MSFTIEGETRQVVYTCTECTYCSTKEHFDSTEDELRCPLCFERSEKL